MKGGDHEEQLGVVGGGGLRALEGVAGEGGLAACDGRLDNPLEGDGPVRGKGEGPLEAGEGGAVLALLKEEAAEGGVSTRGIGGEGGGGAEGAFLEAFSLGPAGAGGGAEAQVEGTRLVSGTLEVSGLAEEILHLAAKGVGCGDAASGNALREDLESLAHGEGTWRVGFKAEESVVMGGGLHGVEALVVEQGGKVELCGGVVGVEDYGLLEQVADRFGGSSVLAASEGKGIKDAGGGRTGPGLFQEIDRPGGGAAFECQVGEQFKGFGPGGVRGGEAKLGGGLLESAFHHQEGAEVVPGGIGVWLSVQGKAEGLLCGARLLQAASGEPEGFPPEGGGLAIRVIPERAAEKPLGARGFSAVEGLDATGGLAFRGASAAGGKQEDQAGGRRKEGASSHDARTIPAVPPPCNGNTSPAVSFRQPVRTYICRLHRHKPTP